MAGNLLTHIKIVSNKEEKSIQNRRKKYPKWKLCAILNKKVCILQEKINGNTGSY